jgi:hypothetical protein
MRRDSPFSDAVKAAAQAISEEFDVLEENMCEDLSHVGAALLRDAGLEPEIVCADLKVLGVESDTDHCWIRVGDWNVDFSAGQYNLMVSYPFVTKKDDPMALEFYGRGSRTLKSKMYWAWEGESRYVPFEMMLEARSEEDLSRLQGDSYCDVYAFYRATQTFRKLMHEAGHMDKIIPPLTIEAQED